MLFRRVTAAVLVPCLALVIAACGDDSSDTKSDPSKSDTKTTTTETVDNTVPEAKTDCSAKGQDLEFTEQPDLPEPVAKTRRTLFLAAASCDYEALGGEALENPDFGFTFGTEKDPIAVWKAADAKQRTMERLARLLSGPYIVRDEGGDTYAWPSVYQDKPSKDDYADLVTTGAYSQAEADSFEQGGSYFGYRIAIKADGAWSYFLTGD